MMESPKRSGMSLLMCNSATRTRRNQRTLRSVIAT